MKVLFLSEKDIEGLITMRNVIKAVERAFEEKGKGRVEMPPKSYVFFKEYDGDFRTMPAYIKRLGAAGVKIVNVHPRNPSLWGMPSIMATILLIDPMNGSLLAIMDGTWITAMRTGAAGGVAAKYLARRDSRVVGMIGAGVQARSQLIALREVMPEIGEVKVTSRTAGSRERYAKEMEEQLGLNVCPVDSVERAVRGSDIVVTVTPVRSPIVADEWIEPGTHINAIGADAPGKEELDPRILKRAKIVVDDLEQALHSGEINVPISRGVLRREDIHAELGEIVSGEKEGRVSPEEITIFDSTGLAIQDVATAWEVYLRARKQGIGHPIELHRSASR
ncbi:TPA: alanine dehydrogenase [Candidatus Bathyarchaeota archaeon]|nr:alanine dehydrogenase [Candidatus Bathyarchaeota archaeon]